MTLEDILCYENIVIQCHDDPDADAIASGWGVQRFLEGQGKSVKLIYGGKNEIQKANLLLMVKQLRIDISHIQTLSIVPDLLICVDCQYGSNKIQAFSAKTVAVIDHHKTEPENFPKLPELREIRDQCASCSTVVWDMLVKAGANDLVREQDLATALYYGLLTDSNGMDTLADSLDIKMRNALEPFCKKDILYQLKTHNLSRTELAIVGRALSNIQYNPDKRFSLTEAEACDPNILGIISDQILEADDIDVCVVFCLLKGGAKISIRSCIQQIPANVLASKLTPGGGGHEDKAGGFLPKALYNPDGKSADTDGERAAALLQERLQQYFDNQTALKVAAEIIPGQARGNILASANVTLNDCFVVRDVRVMTGRYGIFVAMPYKMDRDGQYHDVCYPVTARMWQVIQDVVLTDYSRCCGENTEKTKNQGADTIQPTELSLDVKVYPVKKKASSRFLAYASVTLGNCFVINGIRIAAGKYKNSPFVDMPQEKLNGNEYRDICCFTKQEWKKKLENAVRSSYFRTIHETEKGTSPE